MRTNLNVMQAATAFEAIIDTMNQYRTPKIRSQRTRSKLSPRQLPASCLSLCAALLLAFAAPSGLAVSIDSYGAHAAVDTRKGDGKSRAASQAQAAHGGKVLSVSEENRNGRTVYKVKLLLDSGRIKIVTIQG